MQFSCNGGSSWCTPESYSSSYNTSPYYNFDISNYTNCGCNTNNGPHTISVRYIDSLGNTGTAKSQVIKLDNTAPTCNISYSPELCST
jgi:hypothetical protein